MEFGVHLPVMAWGGEAFTLDSLLLYAETATRLGFRALSTNDHLVFNRPWLDGPTALASVLERTGDMTLATTISLPVVRGPVPLAKALAAIDVLSGGRVVVGVGPGSLDRDYAAVGIPWVERWPRFEEAIQALRALWREGGAIRGTLLLDGRCPPGAVTRATWGSPDLGGELGVECRPATGGPPRRRVACVRIQRDARDLRRELEWPPRAAA